MQILIFLLQTFSLFYNYFFFLYDSTSCPDISHIYIEKQGWPLSHPCCIGYVLSLVSKNDHIKP